MTSRTDEDVLNHIAETFFDAVAAGDMDTVRDSYAPNAAIWHNFDPHVTQTREQNLALLGWVSQNWKDFHFEDVRRHFIPSGFFQQHTMRGIGPDGKAFEAPAVLLVLVDDDGTIIRIEEYFDPGQVPLPES